MVSTRAPVGRPVPPPKRPRPRQAARDVVLSLLALCAFIVPLLLLLPQPGRLEQPPVDVDGTARGAAAQVDFAVPVPDAPAGWTPNAARLEPSGPDGLPTWVVGWVTPSDDYAGIRVTADATERWVRDVVREGDLAGEQDVDGQAWELWSRAPERRSDAPFQALVRTDGDLTYAVIGTAGVPELSELAAAVQVAPVAEPPA